MEDSKQSNSSEYLRGDDLLHNAVFSGFHEELEAVYQQKPEQLNMVDSFGCTPLGYAVIADNLFSVNWLLQKGADINVKMIDGKTAPMIAVLYRRAEVLERILQERFDVDQKDDQGNTLLDLTVSTRDWDALKSIIANKIGNQ